MADSSEPSSVYLNVYDYTTLNSCFQLIGLSGFHSGIEIKNIEYCYCVMDSNPIVTGVVSSEPQSAEYRFNRKLFLGHTTLSDDQIQSIIDELSKKYTSGKYNMFTFNCNHFSDELARTITGTAIPRWLFYTTDCLSHICCCLPTGLVSGLWAIQSIQAQQMKEEAALLQKPH